jgi:membrane protein implicated in regulation of membrane protease activity
VRRARNALPVAAVVGACAVCCPPLVIGPLLLISVAGAAAVGIAVAVAAATPWWLLTALILVGLGATAGAVRALLARRAHRPQAEPGTASATSAVTGDPASPR